MDKRHVKAKYQTAAWRELQKLCFERDHHTCARCGLKGQKNNKYLTLHHITPRPKGMDEFDNLITLCNDCHDFVEERAYTTLAEIRFAGVDNQMELRAQGQSSIVDYDSDSIDQIGYDSSLYDKQIAGLAVRKVTKDWWGRVYGGVRS